MTACLLYYISGKVAERLGNALMRDGISLLPYKAYDRRAGGALPRVLLYDQDFSEEIPDGEVAAFLEEGGAVVGLGKPGETDQPETGATFALDGWLPYPWPERSLATALRAALALSLGRLSVRSAQNTARQIKEFVRVGTALATERNYEAFYRTALTQARVMADADGGSLYLVETGEDGVKRIRFKLAQNHSRPDIPFEEMVLPLNNASISGHVALSGKPLVIEDVYNLPPDAGYSFNRNFDLIHGYRTKSMVAIPMITHKEEIVGVLQLVNKKKDFLTKLASAEETEREAIPFDPATVELLNALSAQVAVCLENNRLYEEIERLFEGFVTASVTAIEQRDPTTSGHSGRVATLTVGLAEAADRVSYGMFASVFFTPEELRELRYAGLLHDFGKVGVREEVLVKPTKLQPHELELLKRRHAFLRRTAERDFFKKRAERLENTGRQGYQAFLQALTVEFEREVKELDAFLELVVASNIPTVLPEGNFNALLEFGGKFYQDIDGSQKPYLTGDEVRYLSIRKGSLDEAERLEIESHVTKTYQFLAKIPWTRNLKNIPGIAYGHHEKLNGHGYPLGLPEHEIPLQTRMMTIADIYDALTAADRPYKKAMPAEKALDILGMEAKDGMLDPRLLELFIEGGIYRLTAAKPG